MIRLAELPRVPGRLNPLPGRHGSLILDDSYTASPAAVDLLRMLQAAAQSTFFVQPAPPPPEPLKLF